MSVTNPRSAGDSFAQAPPALVQAVLANGLRVVIAPDQRIPLVGSSLCVPHGSAEDPPDQPGLAHLCEHLAWTGPHEAEDRDFVWAIEEIGGEAQAKTFHDHMAFSSVVPASELSSLLGVEASRIRLELSLTSERLERNRRVIALESEQRGWSSPSTWLHEGLHRVLYSGTRWHQLPFGSGDGLSNITCESVASWFASSWNSRDAVLALVGDCEPDRAFRELEVLLEDGPASCCPVGRASPISTHNQKPQADPILLVSEGEGSCSLILGWQAPGLGEPGWHEAFLWLWGLARGPESRLAQVLVCETQLAAEVRCSVYPMRSMTTLAVEIEGNPGVASKAITTQLEREFQGLHSGGFLRAHLDFARSLAAFEEELRLESLMARADWLSVLTSFRGAPTTVTDWIDGFARADDAAIRSQGSERMQTPPLRWMLGEPR